MYIRMIKKLLLSVRRIITIMLRILRLKGKNTQIIEDDYIKYDIIKQEK